MIKLIWSVFKMKSIKEFFEAIENTPYFEYIERAATLFMGIKSLAEEKNEVEIVQLMQFEIKIFQLYINSPFLEEYSRRFDSCIDQFPEEQVDYYGSRFNESNNLFLKMRYGDFLIDYKGAHHRKIRKYEIFKEIIPVLLSVRNKHLENIENPYYEYFKCMARGMELSIAFNDVENVNQILKNIQARLREIKDKAMDYRWVLEGSEIIRGLYASKLNNIVDTEYIEDCIELLYTSGTWFRNKYNHELQRAFYKEIINWLKLLKKNEEEIYNYLLKIGESFEEEAVIQQGREEKSNIVRAHFLELAMKHYADIGEKEKIDLMKVAIRESYYNSIEEFKEIKAEITLPEGAINELSDTINIYRKMPPEKILNALCIDANLIPDIESIRKLTKKQQETFVFASFASKAVLTDGRKVFQPGNDEEEFEMNVNENYIRNLQFILDFLLIPIFDMAITEKHMTPKVVMDKLKRWPYLKENNQKIIEVGIDSYFRNDYISSLHVLVPQLEATVRNFFSQAGFSTTSIKKGLAQHEETLNEFLKNDFVVKGLGEKYHKYLQLVLVDQTGLNLRNDIAHGLISIDQCNKAICLIIIYLLLSMTRYHFRKTEDNQCE